MSSSRSEEACITASLSTNANPGTVGGRRGGVKKGVGGEVGGGRETGTSSVAGWMKSGGGEKRGGGRAFNL